MIDQPIYRAVLDDPDNDAPRLVFADWMDEQGDPRGDFIRLQIGMTRAGVTSREREQQRDVSQELLRRYRKRWNAPLHRHLCKTTKIIVRKRRSKIRGWRYSRGFPSHLTVDATTFVHRHTLIAEIGPIQHIRFLGFYDARHLVFRSPCVRPLRSVSFVPMRELRLRTVIEELVASRHVQQLESLDLSHLYVDGNAARALVNAENLPALREVVVHHPAAPFGEIPAFDLLRDRFGRGVVAPVRTATGVDRVPIMRGTRF